MILRVVSPVFHLLPIASLDVSITDPPEQKESEPLLLTKGVVSDWLTATTAALDIAELHKPNTCNTE